MLLSLASMAGPTSRVFLAYVIPNWLALYIAYMHAIYSVHACSTRTRATIDLYSVVEFVSVIEASRSVIFVYYQGRESTCQVISVIEASKSIVLWDWVLMIVTTFTDVEALYPCKLGPACSYQYWATGDVVKLFIIMNWSMPLSSQFHSDCMHMPIIL